MLKPFALAAIVIAVGATGLVAADAPSASSSAPVYPLKIGPTGRYLVDQRGKPFLIAGESPQGMMVNVSERDAELFFANRQSHGFNTAWINLICAKYTGGRDDASTTDGLKPFKNGLDFSAPNEAYFARCDRIIELAAKHGTMVMLDPAETGSFLAVMQKNGVDRCREYGRYLGKRYAKFDNLLWFHGNDYGDHSPENDKLVTAIALGIKEFDDAPFAHDRNRLGRHDGHVARRRALGADRRLERGLHVQPGLSGDAERLQPQDRPSRADVHDRIELRVRKTWRRPAWHAASTCGCRSIRRT